MCVVLGFVAINKGSDGAVASRSAGFASLPAEDDPIMERIEKIRERDYMFVDTLNEYYGEFYNEIWSSYQNWRKFSQTELSMMRKMKRDATMQQLAGALMIAAAIGPM